MKNSWFDIKDPFEEAFAIAIDAAQRHCAGSGDPNSNCSIYHGLWPRLRRIGSAGSVWLNSGNYIDAFRRSAKEGFNRLLVSGSADYSLIAHILHAFRAEGMEPDITVLDVCEAPLLVNRWYAQRHDAQITTIAQNILKFKDEDRAAQGFDVVTTDNFLTNFQPADRTRVVRKWRQLLRPSGKVVTAQRISTEPLNHCLSRNEDDINQRLEWILELARKHAGALDITPEELVQDAARYYKQSNYSKIISAEEFCALFETNGFQVDSADSVAIEENGDGRTTPRYRHLKLLHFLATKINMASVSPHTHAPDR